MNRQDEIHHQLRNLQEKQQTYYQKWNILNTKTNFREQAELSEWRTSSYPLIPKRQLSFRKTNKQSKKQRLQNLMSEKQAVISHNQLSHRYTFLNHHASNQKQEKREYKKKQPYILSLALPKRQQFPSINNEHIQNNQHSKRSMFLKVYSPKYSGAPFHFIKHADNMRNRIKEKSMVENTNKIYWNFNNDEGVESPKNKGKLNGKVKKSKYKSNIDGNNRHLNKETVNELRKCLIFGKKDNYEAKVNV